MLGQDAERRRLKQHDQTTSTTPSQSNYYKHTNPSPYLKPYPSFCYPNLPSRESQSEPCHPKLLHRPVASIHPALLPSLRSPRDRNTHACLRKPSPVPHRRRAACLPTHEPTSSAERAAKLGEREGADVGRIGSAGGYVGSVEPWERYGG
jgi:hypothetical protein